MTLQSDGWPRQIIRHHLFYVRSKPSVNSNWSYRPETPISVQDRRFFCPVWSWNLMDDLENQLATFSMLLQALWIQTRVTVWKSPIWVKISYFLPRLSLKFDGWPPKTIAHSLCATASFVHYFVAICEFKLELQSENAQFGVNFILTSVTLTFDLWPWSLAWISVLSMEITPENVMMIRWHDVK